MKSRRTAYYNGLAAEDIAERLYIAQEGEVLERRWKRRGGEIDLIIRLDGTVVFVEVKARKSLNLAAESLSTAQQKRLIDMANLYLAESELGLNADVRFDVVLVDRSGVAEIIENALSDGW